MVNCTSVLSLKWLFFSVQCYLKSFSLMKLEPECKLTFCFLLWDSFTIKKISGKFNSGHSDIINSFSPHGLVTGSSRLATGLWITFWEALN